LLGRSQILAHRSWQRWVHGVVLRRVPLYVVVFLQLVIILLLVIVLLLLFFLL
jgi:hypothetical protein